MPKLTASTVVVDPETATLVVLREGEDLPEWAAALVGEHLLDSPAAQPKRGKA